MTEKDAAITAELSSVAGSLQGMRDGILLLGEHGCNMGTLDRISSSLLSNAARTKAVIDLLMDEDEYEPSDELECPHCGWWGVVDDLKSGYTFPRYCPRCGKELPEEGCCSGDGGFTPFEQRTGNDD